MSIITRDHWGARAPKSTTRIAGPVLGVAGHYAGSEGKSQYSAAQSAGVVRAIQNQHMDDNGWDDIAYSYLVDRFGNIFEGRGPGRRTAANGTNDGNAHYYAVCLLIGTGDELNDDMKRGWLEARALLITNGGAGAATPPHSSLFSTACPGPARDWFLSGAPSPGAGPIVVDPGQPDNPSPIDPNDYTVEAEVAQLPTISLGSTGQFVRICQGLLVANGHDVGVDGRFGPATQSALREWQSAVSLGADAICGPKTWRRLLCI